MQEITEPTMSEFSLSRLYDYAKHATDYESFKQLEEAINACRLALFRVTDKQNEMDRKAASARLYYNRFWRRAYLSSAEKTDAARKAYADIVSEEHEDKAIVFEQVVKDLERSGWALRTELSTLQNISSNMRQQMRLGGDV